MEEQQLQHEEIARLGSSVLIDFNNGDRFVFARVLPSASLKVGNSMWSLAPLIDAPYGSAFELQRGSLVRIPPPLPQEPMEAQTCQQDACPNSEQCSAPHTRDNRNLIDNNTAQKLSAQDIERMREDCASGKEIVDALIANSTTFQGKTAYSQEKYKKKKQKKYAPFIVIRRPSARRICEAYGVKCPPKIGYLRMDTIALMLSLANVGAHAEVLVMDLVSGILTAAVAERIGGFGSVCTVYCTDKPSPLDIVGLLNLTPSMAGRVFRVSVWELTSLLERHGYVRENHELVHLKKESEGDTAVSGDGNGNLNVEIEAINFDRANKPLNDNHTDTHLQSDLDACTSFIQASAENSESCESTHRNDEKEREAQESMVARSKESNSVHYGRKPDPEDLSRWAKHGFTGLLVSASDYQPWSVIEKLLPFLSPSAAFAIHHRYLQPLAECMHELQRNRMAVALEIVEPWLREYQVLPSRTHPCMQMNATGGYILTGIKISSP